MTFVTGNRITLLKNGGELFPALIGAIDAAKDDIRLEMYIFEHDASGIGVANALMRAARRGVAVRVLVDGFGSRAMPAEWVAELRAAGVLLLVFRPARGGVDFSRARMRRNHRKIVLVDGRVGFVGGINLIDDYTDNESTTDPPSPRYDYAVQVEGPVLAQMYPVVLRLWTSVKWFALKKRGHDLSPPTVSASPVGPSTLAFLVRDNFRHRRDIERAYLQAIRHAKHDVLIACPYFLPGRQLRRTLCAAALRGVNVTILLQGAADFPLLQTATRALYDDLLAAGIALHEYQPAMLHGKIGVVDDGWATVGSSNLDPFSLLLNREANIVCTDPHFVAQLRASVVDEITRNAVRREWREWRARPWWARWGSSLALWCARGMASLMLVRRD